MKRLGLTPCFFYPDSSRPVFGPKSLTYMENDMVNYVARPDVMPILLPDVEDKLLNLYLAECDAFLLQGGSDMAPESYNEKPIQEGRWPGDRHRDLVEFKILDYAIKNKKPVFGICRGFQVINAYFGGTLHQDISSELDTDLNHRDAIEYDKVNHTVDLVKNGLMQKLYDGVNTLQVNSIHHQAIKKLAPDLVVDAKSSEDDIIEAFTHKSHSNIFAVQWHPEFSKTLGNKLCDPAPLYNYFLTLF